MKIQAATRKSFQKKEPEDAYVVNELAGIFGVFDGVTPLDDYRDEDAHNGAYVASNLFRSHFASLTGPVKLEEQLIRANRSLKEKMLSSQIDISWRQYLWSTCAAVVCVRENRTAFAHVGDCMIITLDKLGKTAVITKDLVKDVPIRAVTKRTEDRHRGIFVPEESYFDSSSHLQAYCRWMANTPEGYSVANGMDEMAQYIQSGFLETASLKYLLLISDGMIYQRSGCDTVLHNVLESGLENYMRNMEDWERENEVWPDDKTAILLEF
jgi:serine/threonine protein phosphatase PrpC